MIKQLVALCKKRKINVRSGAKEKSHIIKALKSMRENYTFIRDVNSMTYYFCRVVMLVWQKNGLYRLTELREKLRIEQFLAPLYVRILFCDKNHYKRIVYRYQIEISIAEFFFQVLSIFLWPSLVDWSWLKNISIFPSQQRGSDLRWDQTWP